MSLVRYPTPCLQPLSIFFFVTSWTFCPDASSIVEPPHEDIACCGYELESLGSDSHVIRTADSVFLLPHQRLLFQERSTKARIIRDGCPQGKSRTEEKSSHIHNANERRRSCLHTVQKLL